MFDGITTDVETTVSDKTEYVKMDKLDEIRARCEAATLGPWEYKTNRHPNLNGTPWGWIDGPAGNMCWSGYQSRIDADFIAHAREDIPYLLAEIERLKKHSENLRLDYVDLLDRAEKAEAESRWIPVNERPPEKLGRYLTAYVSTCYKGDNPKKHVGELDWAGEKCGWLINGLHKVTHWRPLPEPPKGE